MVLRAVMPFTQEGKPSIGLFSENHIPDVLRGMVDFIVPGRLLFDENEGAVCAQIVVSDRGGIPAVGALHGGEEMRHA